MGTAPVRRKRVKLLGVVVGALVISSALCASPASAEDPTIIPWTDLLPGFTSGYDPSDANDCKSGKIKCVDSVIREMTRRFDPLAADCDHNSMFALAYLRTTEVYRSAATTPGFFSDPTFINHQDAVFARYYFDAWDDYRHNRIAEVPPAWQVAIRNADEESVAGMGNAFLGFSAHVNRDLPMVLAEIGLVKPDGSSRKPDHDQVNEFLKLVVEPLLDEAAARLDPSMDDAQIDGTTMDETGLLQTLQAWREQAWRNAEAIVNAPTAAHRANVLTSIELNAEIEANLIVAATSYLPVNAEAAVAHLQALGAPSAAISQAQIDRSVNVARGLLGSLASPGATSRNAYCAAHG